MSVTFKELMDSVGAYDSLDTLQLGPSVISNGRWEGRQQCLITVWMWHCKVGLTEFSRHECTNTAGCGYFKASPLKY